MQAMELTFFILGHPATPPDTKVSLEKLCSVLELQLTSEQVEAARLRGQAMTLDAGY